MSSVVVWQSVHMFGRIMEMLSFQQQCKFERVSKEWDSFMTNVNIYGVQSKHLWYKMHKPRFWWIIQKILNKRILRVQKMILNHNICFMYAPQWSCNETVAEKVMGFIPINKLQCKDHLSQISQFHQWQFINVEIRSCWKHCRDIYQNTIGIDAFKKFNFQDISVWCITRHLGTQQYAKFFLLVIKILEQSNNLSHLYILMKEMLIIMQYYQLTSEQGCFLNKCREITFIRSQSIHAWYLSPFENYSNRHVLNQIIYKNTIKFAPNVSIITMDSFSCNFLALITLLKWKPQTLNLFLRFKQEYVNLDVSIECLANHFKKVTQYTKVGYWHHKTAECLWQTFFNMDIFIPHADKRLVAYSLKQQMCKDWLCNFKERIKLFNIKFINIKSNKFIYYYNNINDLIFPEPLPLHIHWNTLAKELSFQVTDCVDVLAHSSD